MRRPSMRIAVGHGRNGRYRVMRNAFSPPRQRRGKNCKPRPCGGVAENRWFDAGAGKNIFFLIIYLSEIFV